MTKEDEIAYIGRLGIGGKDHALNKPWSDEGRGLYLLEIGALISLLPSPPARILDAGAGSGWTSSFLARCGYRVVVTDIAPDMIDLAHKNAEIYGVTLDGALVCDFESMPFTQEFDAVIFYDCLHHSEDEVKALEGAYRALKPGGMCITLEPGTGHAESEISLSAVNNLGVTERDMPPSRIIAAGKIVGFHSMNLFERPKLPLQLSARRRPRGRTLWEIFRRVIGLTTPVALQRGHFVILHK